MNCQRGSALIESLLLIGVLAPMLFGMALMGKYLDVKAAALEASRYAVWERTVWADSRSDWGDVGARKSESRIAEEIGALVLAHPSTTVAPAGRGAGNPLWRNRRHEPFLKGVGITDDSGRPVAVPGALTSHATEAPADALLVDRFAAGPLAGDGLAGVAAGIGEQLSDLGTECAVGVDLERGLGLGVRNFAEAEVMVPTRDFFGPDTAELRFSARAAILSNGWTAFDHETFRRRVDNLTLDELVSCAVLPGQLFAMISLGPDKPLYGEGLPSYPVTEALEPAALPARSER